MKRKVLATLSAGIFAAATLCGVTACGTETPDVPTEKADVEAPAFTDAEATLNLNAAADTQSARYQISDTLFGAFLEDINFAAYALDDNLLANSSFEAITKDWNYGWTATGATMTKQTSGGIFDGTAYNNSSLGVNVNPNYLQLNVAQSGGSLRNSGYAQIPIAVEEGVDYLFSAFIKAPSAVEMTVSVTDGTTVYATETISVLQESDWVKYTRTLTATGTASENLYFELSFSAATTIYLDVITFETTDSTVGIKNYLYEAIAELSPKFIRFPGGCVIEGNGDGGQDTAYDWKNSIGAVVTGTAAGDDDVPAFSYKVNTNGTVQQGEATYGEFATRTPNPDLWAGYPYSYYYDLEYGLGFYDYFLLCESVGASAVPVINCGMSCQGGVPRTNKGMALAGRHDQYVEDYIQDAKDLIAFAKGSVDSTDEHERYWATIRANMGHPEPFEMDYLGIGNEQWDTYYTNYYEKFLKAFAEDDCELYGSVKLIVGNATQFTDCQDPLNNRTGVAQAAAQKYLNRADSVISTIEEYGVHDQHYYRNYMDFFANTELYDYYDRPEENPDTYYEVFVGEYSANEGTDLSGNVYSFDGNDWENSWITALSEAAMMTAFERNGDIVKLAAYAPMFAAWNGRNETNGARQWNVDMMYYTNTQLVKTTNYYVQQLFMQNQGKYLLPGQNSAQQAFKYASGFSSTFEVAGKTSSGKDVTETISKLYAVASLDGSGDIIVKIVNACPDTIKLNIKIANATLGSIATVTQLQNDDYKAVNTLTETAISPETFTIGSFTDGTIGYSLKPYSVSAIRIPVK